MVLICAIRFYLNDN